MRVSSQFGSNLSFNARQLSQWRCSNAKNKAKNVSIIAIEKRDLVFMQNFVKYVENLKNDCWVRKEIMIHSSKTILEILNSDLPNFDKIKMFIATSDNIPCGIFIANIPKTYAPNEAYVYSSRHNSAKNETEIDWLVTWNPTGNEKIKGIGKALVGEYFRTVKKDKFRDVFVHSEIPEYSFATKFYESLGFENIGTKRIKLSNKNSAQTIINSYGDRNDDTVPMIITRKNIGITADRLASEMHRQEFVQISEDARDLISI